MWFRLSLVLLLAAPALAAMPSPEPAFTATCHAPVADFRIQLTSASGDPMEDDMSVVLEKNGGARVTIPLERALYTPREALLNVKNLCDRVTALDAGDRRVVIFFARNGRPTWDDLSLALVDVGAMNVLDVKNAIAAIKGTDGPLALRSAGKNAWDIRLIRETLPDSGCDCAEADIEDWMRISVKNGRLQYRWAR